jgi:hypothetical protein
MRKVLRARGRTLIATFTATVALLALASPALATPKGIFAVFAQCPTSTSGVFLCQYAQTTSGEFAIGSTKVPINKTITLQGGGIPIPGQLNRYTLAHAKNGETLSKTELNVPGGLASLINCEEIKGGGLVEILERGTCKTIFENGVTGVTATTELVDTESNPAIIDIGALAEAEGTAITLPIRVHLKNPLLGEGCYIGSASSPIQLHLTTGTTSPPPPNKSISGKPGNAKAVEEKGRELTEITENSLVDNAFSVPVAEGCGGLVSFLLDPIIDGKVGLPSASGHNTAILNGTLKSATVEEVIASESF